MRLPEGVPDRANGPIMSQVRGPHPTVADGVVQQIGPAFGVPDKLLPMPAQVVVLQVGAPEAVQPATRPVPGHGRFSGREAPSARGTPFSPDRSPP